MPDAADRVRMALAEAGSDLEVVVLGGIIHTRHGQGPVGNVSERDQRTPAKAYAIADVDDLQRCWVCGPEHSDG